MNVKPRDKGAVPLQLLKALFQSLILFCIPGIFLTSFIPTFTIELTRANPERVDATVYRNLLFIVPIIKYTASNVSEPETKFMDGGVIREGRSSSGKIVGEAEDEGLLLLKGTEEKPIEVWISPVNLNDVKYDVQYFIKESKEPFLRLWVVDNWKFGVILPGAILLFCVVVFLMATKSIITGKPIELPKSSRSVQRD